MLLVRKRMVFEIQFVAPLWGECIVPAIHVSCIIGTVWASKELACEGIIV